jgi:hypothetical protein
MGAAVRWTAGVTTGGGVDDAGSAGVEEAAARRAGVEAADAGASAGNAGTDRAAVRWMAGLAADAEVDDAPPSAGSAGAASDAVRRTDGGVEADRAVGRTAAGLEPPGAG